MHEEIDLAELLLRGGEEGFDRFIRADIAGMKPRASEAVFLHRFLHTPLRLFGVVHRQKAEAAGCALLDGVVGDVSRDRAIVRDVEDESLLTFEQAHAISLAKAVAY